MTGLITIDESGDLGIKGTSCFGMGALITARTRALKSASKIIPNDGIEHKWCNSTKEFKEKLFETMSECNFTAVYTVINKNHPKIWNQLYGNELYEAVLRQTIHDAIQVLPCKDFNLFVDCSSFISIQQLRKIAEEESRTFNANLIKCEKITSQQNKCLQLSDFIIGAARLWYETGDDTLKILDKKVSIARRY